MTPPDPKVDVEGMRKAHDWMFDGRVMFCRKCFQKTSAPGRDGSQMDTACPGFGEASIKIIALSKDSPS
jgi:hypothetical protein